MFCQVNGVYTLLLSDENVGLDQILIQLKEVAPQWRSLAESVGLDREAVDGISEYYVCSKTRNYMYNYTAHHSLMYMYITFCMQFMWTAC